MAYTATHKHARISASKVRPLAKLIRGQRVDDALAILRFQPQRGARMLEKVLKSALGNAEDLRAPNLAGLRVVDARIDARLARPDHGRQAGDRFVGRRLEAYHTRTQTGRASGIDGCIAVR